MNPFKIFEKKSKSDKKQMKELKKYPCDCYLSNALYFIEAGETDVAYKEICYAILRSGGKLSDSQLKKFNKFIEKLIGRLEEEQNKKEEFYHKVLDDGNLPCIYDASDMTEAEIDEIKKVIQIVNQLAEEYKSIMNYNTLLNDIKSQLKQFIADSNNIDYNRALVEAIEVIDKKTEEYKGGWIPCSERLPEEPRKIIAEIEDVLDLINANVLTEYNVTLHGAKLTTSMYYAGNGFWFDEASREFYPVIAWQPLPEVYQPLAAVTKED